MIIAHDIRNVQCFGCLRIGRALERGWLRAGVDSVNKVKPKALQLLHIYISSLGKDDVVFKPSRSRMIGSATRDGELGTCDNDASS